MQTTFTAISVIIKKTFSTLMFTVKNNIIELYQRNHLDLQIIMIYIAKITILKSKCDKNIKIKHQSLIKNKNYFFNLYFRTNLITRKFIISTKAVITFNQEIISMNNFNFTLKKIIKSQILEKINSFVKSAQIIVIKKICFANVFIEKTMIINSKMSY